MHKKFSTEKTLTNSIFSILDNFNQFTFIQVPHAPKKASSTPNRRNGQDDESGTGGASSAGQKVLLSDLQNFLSGLQSGSENVSSGRNIDLASAINVESLDKIYTEAEQS